MSGLARAARTVAFQAGAVALGLVLSSLVLVTIGLSPADSLSTLLEGAFGSHVALVQTTLKAVPLALCGLAVAVPLRMRIWNIGAEGQCLLGAIGVTWFALRFPGLPHGFLLALTPHAALAGLTRSQRV